MTNATHTPTPSHQPLIQAALFPSCETRSTTAPRAGRHTADACYGGYHRDVRAAGRSLISWARERRGAC